MPQTVRVSNKDFKEVHANFRSEIQRQLMRQIPASLLLRISPGSCKMLDRFASDLADQLVKQLVEVRRSALKYLRRMNKNRSAKQR